MGRRAAGEEYLYATEAAAREALAAALAPAFDVIHEVALRLSGDQPTVRVDAVARCRSTGWLVAFEIKQGYFNSSEYAAAIRQATDYRSAAVEDPALPSAEQGKRLAAAVLFPNWEAGSAVRKRGQFDREARGMELLAAKFRVGAAAINQAGLTIVMAQQRLWSTERGWGYDAENVLFGKRQRASGRQAESNLLRPDHP